MEKLARKKYNIKVVVISLITLIFLCSSIAFTINGIYTIAEDEAYEMLHLETKEFKNDINLQIYSDRENLMTMANFAAELHESGQSYELLFKSFKEIGLYENIGIFLPGNILVTKAGVTEVGNKLSFEEEVKKVGYTSGIEKDLTGSNKEIVRTSVPVIARDGSTVGIMYGIIDIEKFENRYIDKLEAIGASLFVIEDKTGDFIIDTKHDVNANISELEFAKFHGEFSYEQIINNMSNGGNGFSSFVSPLNGNILYAHYAPLNFADWHIMLMKPESVVFGEARKTGSYMFLMAAIVSLIMLLYILFVFVSERKNLVINVNASIIRKKLLEMNRNQNKAYGALEDITNFAKARSAFFVDTYGEDYEFIIPSMKNKRLEGTDRDFFILKLLNYVAKQKNESGADVYVETVYTGELQHETPDFYELLLKNDIKSLNIVVVSNNNSNVSVIGVVNSRNKQTNSLLREIAICFSMAVYNRKHLSKTEAMAITDALTGISNRMAYKRDIKILSKKKINNLTCIYIDVNELSYYNNKYGHAAGDQLLIFIAETLINEFNDSFVYRMGGDEFLIFTEGLDKEEINERIKRAKGLIEEMKYHISVGIKTSEDDIELEELVKGAEKLMYEEKAKYYQNNDAPNEISSVAEGRQFIKTGIKEVDASLSVMREHYFGVYYVSLKTDKAVQVLAPSNYFIISSEENKFSDVLKQYFHDAVKPEFHRMLLSFMQYDIIEKQLAENVIPRVSYVKKDGEKIMLSVYRIDDSEADTIWVFEKVEEYSFGET